MSYQSQLIGFSNSQVTFIPDGQISPVDKCFVKEGDQSEELDVVGTERGRNATELPRSIGVIPIFEIGTIHPSG